MNILTLITMGAVFVIVLACIWHAVKASGMFGKTPGAIIAVCVAALCAISISCSELRGLLLPYEALALTLLLLLFLLLISKLAISLNINIYDFIRPSKDKKETKGKEKKQKGKENKHIGKPVPLLPKSITKPATVPHAPWRILQ